MVEVTALLPGQRLRSTRGSIAFCSVTLIEADRRILVDVGHVGRRTAVVDALADRGLSPRDIDVLVLSHAHWDHAQNADVFADADVLIHPLELRYARRPHRNDWATPPWTGLMLDAIPHLVEVDEGYQIAPGVSVLHTPGHTPGSISVAAETDDGLVLVTGDVMHFPSAAVTGRNPLVFWSQAQADASIARLAGLGDAFYPGHDRPFRLTSSSEGFEYLLPLDLELWGLEPDQPGLVWNNDTRAPWVMPNIDEQRMEDLTDD